MLELKNISKTYEGKPLLRDISFKVGRGETVCLLGASGSGKSTILRIVAGLENAEGGQILFDGMDLAQTPPHQRDFGLVFQDYALFPHLDVFENVAFGLRMRRMRPPAHSGTLENVPYAWDNFDKWMRRMRSLPHSRTFENVSYAEEIKRRVHEMLELVNLQGFETRNVTDLSGGEQQRVALARALAPQPRLLMFDEPLGALDRSLKEELLDELRGILHRTEIPAIYVTHDPEEAFAIADRILVLHDGIILRDAAPHEIWKQPQSVFVAKLLGIGNIIEGEASALKDEPFDGTQSGSGWRKVKTGLGIFSVECSHAHHDDEKLSLLIVSQEDGKEEIKVIVEDVLFRQNQFQVKGRGVAMSGEALSNDGLTFHMKEAPRVGELVTVKVRIQCLG